MARPLDIANIDAAVLETLKRLKKTRGGIRVELHKRARNLTHSGVGNLNKNELNAAVDRLAYYGYIELSGSGVTITAKGRELRGSQVDYNTNIPKQRAGKLPPLATFHPSTKTVPKHAGNDVDIADSCGQHSSQDTSDMHEDDGPPSIDKSVEDFIECSEAFVRSLNRVIEDAQRACAVRENLRAALFGDQFPAEEKGRLTGMVQTVISLVGEIKEQLGNELLFNNPAEIDDPFAE